MLLLFPPDTCSPTIKSIEFLNSSFVNRHSSIAVENRSHNVIEFFFTKRPVPRTATGLTPDTRNLKPKPAKPEMNIED